MYQSEESNLELLLDEEQEELKKAKFRQEAHRLISKVGDSHKSRQTLVKSYRRINAMIDRIEQDNFNFQDDVNLLDDVLTSAYFYQPFPMDDPHLLYRTRQGIQYSKANRRLKAPAIQIEDQIISASQKLVKVSATKTQFTIKIESQPSSRIIYSNIPNSHPLLPTHHKNALIADPNSHFYENTRENDVTDILTPPCQLNILAFNQSKMNSRLISLKIVTERNEIGHHTGLGNYAFRPQVSLPFDQSSFQSGESQSYNNVQENNEESPQG